MCIRDRDDDLNVRYIASNGKEYGDQISKKILEDETEIRLSLIHI